MNFKCTLVRWGEWKEKWIFLFLIECVFKCVCAHLLMTGLYYWNFVGLSIWKAQQFVMWPVAKGSSFILFANNIKIPVVRHGNGAEWGDVLHFIITLCWPWATLTDGLMGVCFIRTKIETLIKDALSFNQSWTHGIVHYSDLIRNLSFSNFDLIIYCLSSCFSQSFPKLLQYKCVHQLFTYGICLISLICGVWRTNNPSICWCCEASGNPVIDGILYFTHMMFDYYIILIINQMYKMGWKCSGNMFPATL